LPHCWFFARIFARVYGGMAHRCIAHGRTTRRVATAAPGIVTFAAAVIALFTLLAAHTCIAQRQRRKTFGASFGFFTRRYVIRSWTLAGGSRFSRVAAPLHFLYPLRAACSPPRGRTCAADLWFRALKISTWRNARCSSAHRTAPRITARVRCLRTHCRATHMKVSALAPHYFVFAALLHVRHLFSGSLFASFLRAKAVIADVHFVT